MNQKLIRHTPAETHDTPWEMTVYPTGVDVYLINTDRTYSIAWDEIQDLDRLSTRLGFMTVATFKWLCIELGQQYSKHQATVE